jgi:acyl-CoA reductase-like NAD-dependent aldehyde dehydrogenase
MAAEVAGKIASDAQQGLLAAAAVRAAIGGGASMERRDKILQLAEDALGRAAKDLAVSKSALLGGATSQDARLRAGEACDALELCCDRLLLVDLLLDPTTRAPVPGADDDDSNVRLRAATLEKAMEMAEDCASLVRRARQDAFGAPAT